MHVIRWFALVMVAAVVLPGCSRKVNDEELIRQVLDEGAAALEARDATRAAATLDESYADERKRDKKALRQMATFVLMQGPVLVAMQSVGIEVHGDTADVALVVLALQGNDQLKTAKDLLPTNARTYNLKLSMTRASGAWRVAAINGLGGGVGSGVGGGIGGGD